MLGSFPKYHGPKFLMLEVLELAKLLSNTPATSATCERSVKAATGGVLLKKLFLKISQYSRESNCVGVSF